MRNKNDTLRDLFGLLESMKIDPQKAKDESRKIWGMD